MLNGSTWDLAYVLNLAYVLKMGCTDFETQNLESCGEYNGDIPLKKKSRDVKWISLEEPAVFIKIY